MITGLPSLSYEQQQQAVERIQQLMSEGMSSGQAIQLVAAEIRENHTGEMITASFDDDEDDEDNNEEIDQDYGDEDEEDENY